MRRWRSWVLEALLALVCLGLGLTAPGFLSADNLATILRSIGEIGIIALGMTLVIVAGEIDLSVGSMVALAGCLTARLVGMGLPIPLAIGASLLAGALGGGLIGWIRNRFGVPSFITSLALLTALRGLALKMTGGFPLTPFPPGYGRLGGGHLLGIPVSGLILAAVFVAVLVLMEHTVFGRSIYAVGGNAEAARLSGIDVARVRTGALALTGALAALSGVLLSSRLLAGTPTVGVGWELDVIAAVIVGGTSLKGGSGRVWGTLVGVVFIGVIVDGMRLLDVHEDGQLIARGGIVVLAVLLSRLEDE